MARDAPHTLRLVGRERAWGSFNRRAKIVERAYVELHRRQAAEVVRHHGDEPSEAFLAEIADAALATGAFRSQAWQLALALHGKPARHNVEKVIDLRDAIRHHALLP